MSAAASSRKNLRSQVREFVFEYGILLLKFADRYGLAVLALISSALVGWLIANGVSDYTKGGWELHIQQRALGINIHFHHWYYGIPLGLIALLLIKKQATLSIFLFGLGATLSTHSFVNEMGIPSIFEGGETLRVPFEIYLPAVTLFCALYAFFIIRREEWLVRARERDELAVTYFVENAKVATTLATLDAWSVKHFGHRRFHRDRWTDIKYCYWSQVDRDLSGEWQLHWNCAPFDDHSYVLVIKLNHVPMVGRKGTLDEWLLEIHALLKPTTQLALSDSPVGSPEAAAPDHAQEAYRTGPKASSSGPPARDRDGADEPAAPTGPNGNAADSAPAVKVDASKT
jgi:hypothetical protein